VRHVRRFVAELLAGHPDHDDVALCATELATNAIRHTASGRGGLFATELSWAGMTIRLAVADGGAPTGPAIRQHDPAVLDEAGRGLDVVARLSDSYGVEGDHRGRVIWAQFHSADRTAVPAARVPLSPQPATEADAAMLAQRYAGWHTWFGPWTRQWWALPKRGSGSVALITAPSAGALASHLDAIQGDPRHAGPGLRSYLR
jgi:anti-sigma regulatory factor (Ser/Thr protein kinase)